jgi:hypothetical protein
VSPLFALISSLNLDINGGPDQVGRFQGVEKMITSRLLLEDIVEKGFKELIKPNDHIKILATPKHESINRGVAV